MRIDYSQLQTFISCPMKYYLRYQLGLEKIRVDERDVDRLFGSCVHEGLDLYYSGKPMDEVVKVFDSFIDVEGEQHKTKANGIALLIEYEKYYKAIDKDIEVLSTEVSDSFKIGDIDYIVKVDGMVKMRDNIYAMEHKTTKRIDYRYFERFSPSMQVSGYVDYVGRSQGSASGLILNAMQSGFRQRAYRGEPAGFHCAFQREIINRTPQQIEDFEKNVIIWTDKLKCSLCDDVWGKNEGNCMQYRGCTYRELCLTSCGIKLDEQIKEAMYEKVDTKAYLNEKKEKETSNTEKTRQV